MCLLLAFLVQVLFIGIAESNCLINLPECNSDPCGINEDPNCDLSNGAGCDQCAAGFFTISTGHLCVDCASSVGGVDNAGCLNCDSMGCQQCDTGYWRLWDHECGVYYCRGEDLECASYDNELHCIGDETCSWVVDVIDGINVNYCKCNGQGDQDVIFLLDSSGSIDNDEWAQQEEFVRDLIRTGITPTTRVGIVHFSTTAFVVHHLTDSQNENDLIAAVTNSRQVSSLTYTDLGVDLAIDELVADSNTDNKLIILITDGQSQSGHNPCTDGFDFEFQLESLDIVVSIVQVSDFDITGIECLPFANHETVLEGDISAIDDFSQFSNVVSFINQYLCVDGDRLGCPNECTSSPCPCNQVSHCAVCNEGSGCSQCEDGYFKIDVNHNCEFCQSVTGDGCEECVDGVGCQTCKQGYDMVQDPTCGGGINVCELNCQATFGAGCVDCNDYEGCLECENGHIKFYHEQSGLWVCQEDGGCPRERKAWHTLTQNERNLYINAFLELEEVLNGQLPTGVFSEAHGGDPLFQAHGSSTFLPWHRYFIWELESQIRDLGGEYSCFGMPYWDWGHDAEELQAIIFNSGLGNRGDAGDDNCVTDPFFSINEYITPTRSLSACPGGAAQCCLRRASDTNDFIYPSGTIVSDIIQNPQFVNFASSWEGTHGSPHCTTVGGRMCDFYNSPDDPIFYLHHTFVDFVWALWQDCYNYELIDENDLDANTDAYQVFGGTTDQQLDAELRFFDIESYPNSYYSRAKPTARNQHDITKWNVIYDRGTFFDEGLVLEEFRCENNINPQWFTESRRRATRRRMSHTCDIDFQACNNIDGNGCSCDEVTPNTCQFCNSGSGCGQCATDYWKQSNSHQCIHCQDTFGEGCLFCQDGYYGGCGQCDEQNGYIREWSSVCGTHVCRNTNPTVAPTEDPLVERIEFIIDQWDNVVNAPENDGLTQIQKEQLFSQILCDRAREIKINNGLLEECNFTSDDFQDCNDLPIDPITGDIDISLEDLLLRSNLDCLKSIRSKFYPWASGSNSLLKLCNGGYDPTC